MLNKALPRDANNVGVQVLTGLLLLDGDTKTATITTAQVASNVITLTTADDHEISIGQQIVVALSPASTTYDGTYVVTGVPSSKQLAVNKTIGDTGPTTVTGTVSCSGWISPISSDTTEVVLTFPANSFALSVYASDNDVELRKVAGGALYGVIPIPKTTWFEIPGKPSDKIYFGRSSATLLYFAFQSLNS
jgi:hypothetical protein